MKITIITPLGVGFVGVDEEGKPHLDAENQEVKNLLAYEFSKAVNERGQKYDSNNFDLVNFYILMQEQQDMILVPDFELLSLMAIEDNLTLN